MVASIYPFTDTHISHGTYRLLQDASRLAQPKLPCFLMTAKRGEDENQGRRVNKKDALVERIA